MIPVVFIHFGECEYAPATIAQAKARGNEVVFLNPPRDSLYDHPFARAYEHLSTNHVYFELACIVRWFMLRDWMLENGVPDVLYCDTDVLLFANVESEIHSDEYYHNCDFTLSLGTSGHTSFWKRDVLEWLCGFLGRTYRDRNETFQECARIYADMREQGLAGGVSDMLLLKMFAASSAGTLRVGEMSEVRNGGYWDHNINALDDFAGFMERKAILFLNGEPTAYYLPTDERVRFYSLHMQGGAKRWINQYASATPF